MAPSFDKDEPENLDRFIAEVKDIFETTNTTLDEANIVIAIKYDAR
jgi:hypothetical protein